MIKQVLRSNKSGASIIILIFSIIAIFSLAGFAIDLGIILNARYELQKSVESTALLTISQYEPYENAGNQIQYPSDAQLADNSTGFVKVNYDAFRNSNSFMLLGADTNVSVEFGSDLQKFSKAIKVESESNIQTYFLNILGIRNVKARSVAAAMNSPFYISGNFPKPFGSLINGLGSYRDTEIKEPLGGDTSALANPTTTVYNINNDIKNLYGPPDSNVLSLGPGGYITLRPPASLIDGKGADLVIFERGHAEGYFVFAGNDADPNNPYIDASSPGGGISWVNVSCTGIPLYTRTDGPVGAYTTPVTVGATAAGTETKFYGSGLFDLGASCSDGYNGNAKVVKYLKIIDDNSEDGFFIQPATGVTSPDAIPAILPGEHSHFSPGADLDAIGIFHHARLISVSDFNKDTDGDLLIDVLEEMMGYDPTASTDGSATNDDGIEHVGYTTNGVGTSLPKAPSGRLIYDYVRNAPADISPPYYAVTP